MPNESSISPKLAWTLADQIGHAYSIVLALSQEQLVEEPLTVTEFVALAILSTFPEGLTQTAWGRYQGVSRQRAHKVSSKLEAEKLIRLARHGRASTATLTAAGRRFVKRLEPRLSALYAAGLRGLSSSEAEQLSHLLDKMLSHADAL